MSYIRTLKDGTTETWMVDDTTVFVHTPSKLNEEIKVAVLFDIETFRPLVAAAFYNGTDIVASYHKEHGKVTGRYEGHKTFKKELKTAYNKKKTIPADVRKALVI